MPKWATDFHTTMVFTTISVCSLDFALTIAFALGSRRQASTPSLLLRGFGSALGCFLQQAVHRI